MANFSRPHFKNELLWQQAMTHRSFSNEQASKPAEAVPHNERLEFLGDAILTFLSGDYLYARYPNKPEGELTTMRATLVDQPQLCQFAQALDIGQYLRMGKGADQEGGRDSSRLLCSVFEAMIGAYFLDTERNVQAVSAYVIPFFDSVVPSVVGRAIKDAKTQLQEWAPKKGKRLEYAELGSSGPDYDKEFVVEVRINGKIYGRGRGKSKQKAQKAAAKATLSWL
ncbi:MAG: ribonuclease III [Phormidesmis sp.]